MPIVAATGLAGGSSAASAFGSNRPQSVATPTRAAFVQQQFRSLVWESAVVRELYGKVARDTKDDPIPTFFDLEEDCYAIAKERGEILGSHARRFRVTVDAILTESDLPFALTLPGAHLVDDELAADMDVAIASIDNVDFSTGQTTLIVWGRVGDVPVSDDRIRNSPALASGVATVLGVGVAITTGAEQVVEAAGSASAVAVGEGGYPAVGDATASSAAVAVGAAVQTGFSLLSGDAQSGTDKLLLSGDAQSGTDRELYGEQ